MVVRVRAEHRLDATLAIWFRDHSAFVWRVLRAHGVPDSDLEDACQEVFLVAQRKITNWRDDARPTTWLYATAWRVASDWKKRGHVRFERVEAVPTERVIAATQHVEQERRQAREQLYRWIADLSEEQRKVFVLFEIEELSMKEIAAMLELPLSTAYHRLESARTALREAYLAEEEP